jgi:hypothetical protein
LSRGDGVATVEFDRKIPLLVPYMKTTPQAVL